MRQQCADPAGHRPTGVRRVAVIVLVVGALLGLTVACVPDVTPSDASGLFVTLGSGRLELHWNEDGAATHGYDVERTSDAQPLWSALGSTTDTSMVVTDVAEGVGYQFRVRVAATPDAVAGAWSAAVAAWYVEPVLPVVRIDTAARAPIVGTETYVAGHVAIDPNGSPVAAYSGSMQIKGRGNSTANQPKRPFKIKLDSKSPLMGMSSEKDWVLLANAFDRSSLRNLVSAQLGRATQLAWTPDSRFVEVVLNGEYQGVYQLAEQVEVSAKRVAIDVMDDDDTSGGYLLEVDDRLEANLEPGFRTSRGLPIVVKDPEPASADQLERIRRDVQRFEDAVFAPDFADPSTGYRAELDVDSFIDWYLVEELLANKDAMWSSTFVHRSTGGPLTFGPLWDFDVSMGSPYFGAQPAPVGWWVRRVDQPLVSRLFTDPTFVQQVVDRWDTFRTAFQAVAASIEPQGAALHPATQHDALRWGYSVAPTDEPAFLRDWLTTRIAWIDAQLHTPTA